MKSNDELRRNDGNKPNLFQTKYMKPMTKKNWLWICRAFRLSVVIKLIDRNSIFVSHSNCSASSMLLFLLLLLFFIYLSLCVCVSLSTTVIPKNKKIISEQMFQICSQLIVRINLKIFKTKFLIFDEITFDRVTLRIK